MSKMRATKKIHRSTCKYKPYRRRKPICKTKFQIDTFTHCPNQSTSQMIILPLYHDSIRFASIIKNSQLSETFSLAHLHLNHIISIGGGNTHLVAVCKLPYEECETIYIWKKCHGYLWTCESLYNQVSITLDDPLLQYSSGDGHTIMRTRKHLYLFGQNHWNQLNDTTDCVIQDVTKFKESVIVDQIACGCSHTIYLVKQNGEDKLFSRGSNTFGQTGVITNESYHGWREIHWKSMANCHDIYSIYCHRNNTLIVTKENEWIIFGEYAKVRGAMYIMFKVNHRLLKPEYIQSVHCIVNHKIMIHVKIQNVKSHNSYFLSMEPNARSKETVAISFLFGITKNSTLQSFSTDLSLYHFGRKSVNIWNGIHQWQSMNNNDNGDLITVNKSVLMECLNIPSMYTSHAIKQFHLTQDALYILMDHHNELENQLADNLYLAQRNNYFADSTVEIYFSNQ